MLNLTVNRLKSNRVKAESTDEDLTPQKKCEELGRVNTKFFNYSYGSE